MLRIINTTDTKEIKKKTNSSFVNLRTLCFEIFFAPEGKPLPNAAALGREETHA